jgi:ADP-L-glycero-D-manno-heptose 6-epimerase
MVTRSGGVVVTGGAGFIGRHVVAAINRRGEHDLAIVDHLDGCPRKVRNLSGLRFEEYFDRDEFIQLVRRRRIAPPRAILHLGACSSTTETRAGYLARNNYRYTRTLCQWALEHGTRFIYASSAATYGDGALGYHDDHARLPRLRPANLYARSKHLVDLWAWRTGVLDRIVGLKFFNVYGPHEDHKGDMRSMVLKAFEQVRDTGVIRLFRSHVAGCADGAQSRDFVDVRDAAAVAVFFLDETRATGLFNCGTGRARTWLELATFVAEAMGREPRIQFVDMPEPLRAGYQYHTQADVAKLREAGYHSAFIDLEEGVHDYVHHLVGRPRWRDGAQEG